MKKILYLMSIDWSWIAQRPQFLAMKLSQWYEVQVIYPKQIIKRWKSQKALPIPKSSGYGICFPFQEKIKILEKISQNSYRRAIGDVSQYDAVYIGSPELYEFVSDYTGTIIFDCMDDYFALAENEIKRQRVGYWHKKLLERADLIFVSSQFLKEQLLKQDIEREPILVRNGFNSNKVCPIKTAEKKTNYKLGYIGTISSWFDFEIMEAILEGHKNLKLHLIGPAGGYTKYEKENIHFEGVVEHAGLYEYIEDYDCLIMPFQVNQIVLAVDPVKLYEYIAFGKCIVSVFYPEVERFGEYVYFYRNQEELSELMSDLTEKGFPPKYNYEQQQKFINENTWDARSKVIRESIEHIWD